jgi:putative addiction module CopG family antidote
LVEFVESQVRAGGYADASEVVREALRDLRHKGDPAEIDSAELAELLLEAVRSPHRPMQPDEFERIRERIRNGPAA